MVAIIVDYAHTQGFAPELEAAVDAPELFQSVSNLLNRDVEAKTDGDGPGCVEHVVTSRNVKQKLAQILATINHMKTTDRSLCLRIEQAFGRCNLKIRAAPGAIGDRAPLDLREQAANQ